MIRDIETLGEILDGDPLPILFQGKVHHRLECILTLTREDKAHSIIRLISLNIENSGMKINRKRDPASGRRYPRLLCGCILFTPPG
jgi:hypothetical protein